MVLFISIATLILTIVQTFYNYRINKTGLYLAGFLITLSISAIVHYFFFREQTEWNIAFFYGHFMPLSYLTGPMLFFYVRGTLKDSSCLSKKDYLHFLPFIISLLSILPYYFVDFETKIQIARKLIENPNYSRLIDISWLYNNSYNVLARPIFILIYLFVCLYLLVRFSLSNNKAVIIKKQQLFMTYWLYALSIIAGLCTASYLIITIDYFNGQLLTRESINSLLLNSIAGFLYSIIPILMLVFPQVLYGIPIVNERAVFQEKEAEKKSKKTIKKLEEEEKETFEKLAAMILEYMKTEKPFTDHNYSLDDLAASLNIQKHHLYYCFNTVLNSRFTTIRTQMRVDYAKECLLKGDLNTLSMEGIWTKTGFSSRTNFFVSFKEVTGVTPLDFIKNNKLDKLSIV
jgi:AraC-like DNA-binding protein